MRFFTIFRNLKLGLKLNIVLVLAFALLLAAIVVIMSGSTQNLTRQTGRQRAAQQAEVIQKRFVEAEEILLTEGKVLINTLGLIEAVANKDGDTVKLKLLTGTARLDLDEVDVVDAAGLYLSERETKPSQSHVEDEEALMSLALLGIETTGIVIEGESEILLAAAVPMKDESGAIVGALLVGREVDNEFLAEINFFRENVPLVLIRDGQILAQSSVEEAHSTIPTTGELPFLNDVAIGQALNGQTVIADDLISFGGIPHAMVHMPLTVGGQTEAVIAIVPNMSELVTFQNQLITNTTLSFVVLALVVVVIVALFVRQSITVPLNKLQQLAQRMAGGDYLQRVAATTRDEVGRLGQTFNEMAEAVQIRETELRGLADELEQHSRAIETSSEVGRRLSTILDEKQLVSEVVEQVRLAFDYYYAHIYIFDEVKEKLVMTGGTGEAGQMMLARGHTLDKGQGLVGRAAETNTAVLVQDVAEAEGWLPNPLLPDTKAEVAVPIALGEEVLGVLDVQHNVAGSLTQAQADLIQSIANQVAIALRNARAYTRTQRQVEREVMVNTIAQKIQGATTVDSAMQIAVRELGRALGKGRTQVRLKVAPSENNGQE